MGSESLSKLAEDVFDETDEEIRSCSCEATTDFLKLNPCTLRDSFISVSTFKGVVLILRWFGGAAFELVGVLSPLALNGTCLYRLVILLPLLTAVGIDGVVVCGDDVLVLKDWFW